MSYPENPETIVLKNKFYSNGLKEIDIWNYYQKNKRLLLEQTKNRDLMFFIATELNKFVIRRKGKDGYIRLTQNNYNNIMTGRTVSVHSSIGLYEDIGIVDIDTDNWSEAKRAAKNVYEVMLDAPFAKRVSIRYTGKESFHIFFTLMRKIRVDSIKFLLENYLRKTDLIKQYTIQPKRTGKVPNLDIWASNKFKGNFISLYSLSIWGLKCMEVPYEKILSFNQRNAEIKV